MSALGTAVRLCAVAGAAAALAASASSSANRPPPSAGPQPGEAPPPASAMDAQRALGLWKSSFGPVKIEPDRERGSGGLNGVWVYKRAGQEVIGYFAGQLGGNVLQFRWQEPSQPSDLVGEGYLVFDPGGRSFTGRWWTAARDRGGEWNGWRAGPRGAGPPPDPDGGNPSEGETPPAWTPAEQAPRQRGPAEQAPRQEGPAEQAPPPGEPPPPPPESI